MGGEAAGLDSDAFTAPAPGVEGGAADLAGDMPTDADHFENGVVITLPVTYPPLTVEDQDGRAPHIGAIYPLEPRARGSNFHLWAGARRAPASLQLLQL